MRGYQLRHLGLNPIIQKTFNYLFAFAGAFAGLLAGTFAVEFAGAVTVAFAGASVLAGAAFALLRSVIGGCVTGCSVAVSGLEFKTETPPCKAGIAISKAESIKTVAAAIVIFDKTVCAPRGVNAELEILLVKSAPASVLPGCNKTDTTSSKHEIKNNA